ncbi:MAG: hypothetical protein JXA89_01170 [Anaerolineae bacterium]|nr:hypothetical protein [Anaerolineae bacterium]
MSDVPAMEWLLEPENPSARYLTLRHLMGRDEQDEQVIAAREAIAGLHIVRTILDAQYPAGHWVKPGRGYSPKYKATIWQLIFLTDLGMPGTPAIARACEHVLQNAFHAGYGLFSAHKHSTGIYPCLNGSLMRALVHFGYVAHPTVQIVIQALIDWVETVGFACPRNAIQARKRTSWQACVWGCVKVLRGFAALPKEKQTRAIRRIVGQGIDLLRTRDLLDNQQPMLIETDSHWLQPGFPLGDHSDLLEALLALAEWDAAGGLDQTIRFIIDQRGRDRRWQLGYTPAKMWADFGSVGEPNKWITLRALDVIERTRRLKP